MLPNANRDDRSAVPCSSVLSEPNILQKRELYIYLLTCPYLLQGTLHMFRDGYCLHFIDTDTAYRYRYLSILLSILFFFHKKICEIFLKILSLFITAEL